MKSATGAHTGTGTWLLQRATALVLAAALPGLMIHFLIARPVDFLAWQTLFAPLWVRVLGLLAMTALALHAWVGMRDIFMDYVHPTLIRLVLHVLVILALVAYAAWAAQILWSVQ